MADFRLINAVRELLGTVDSGNHIVSTERWLAAMEGLRGALMRDPADALAAQPAAEPVALDDVSAKLGAVRLCLTDGDPLGASLALVEIEAVIDRLRMAARSAAQPARAGGDAPRPFDTAPKDGSIVKLLVQFESESPGEPNVINGAGSFVDDLGPCWTIGSNNRDNTGINTWEFVGWNWEQDCFVHATTDEGHQVIGWLPFDSAALAAAPQPAASAEVLNALDRMDALLDPGCGLLTVPEHSATVQASRDDMAIIRAAIITASPAEQPAAAEPATPQQEASEAHHLTDAQITGLQEVALSIFNVPGAPQETRDVIEWFIGMLRVQAEGASRAAPVAPVEQPAASTVPAGWTDDQMLRFAAYAAAEFRAHLADDLLLSWFRESEAGRAPAAPAAVEREALDDEREADYYTIMRLGQLLAQIAVIIHGPELALRRRGYAQLPEEVAKLKAMVEQPAESTVPDCQRCSGSGEDPEGFFDQSKGPDGDTHDGPCRACGGSGAARAAASTVPAILDADLSRACVKAWDGSSYTSGECDAVHPMFAFAFEAGAVAALAAAAPAAVEREAQ